ncbi:DNA repair protein Nse1 [Penicillium taxi]|uniref:DNA repair protein Nse1 n=1 Tax=Penicillium taxi TaxID=168475 RepID=UPI0025455C26|nr:DNA repair protein Nse1 [Penicillium taxi]KAJ5885367.1 DNA repair protein Nse1 [Penicillium taxi]
MSGSYDDSNRAFLQAFMARSSMTFEEAQPILAAISTVKENRTINVNDITEEHLSSYISLANAAISPFDLEIRSSLNQAINHEEDEDISPTRVYALVNTTSDPLTQLATTYSADEIAFVKRILDGMFITNNDRIKEGMVIPSMEAVQLARISDPNRRRTGNTAVQPNQGVTAQNLTLPQAETTLKNLVSEGWLQKSRKEFYSLTPRGLMELRGWLVMEYNQTEDGREMNRIKFCSACRDIVTVGQRCADRECTGRLHDHCMRNFFRIQKSENCPKCKKDWPGNMFVGERAMALKKTTNTPRPRVSLNQNSQADGSDEESEEDEG